MWYIGRQRVTSSYIAPVGGGHHSATFDVDERVIRNGAEFLAAMQREVARKA
ncbi:MAG: hypothetical protein ABSC04_19340 [Syntrophobacteraceae bacterium]